jgi:hypothetical protein
LQRLCREQQVILFMLMAAAFNGLLHRIPVGGQSPDALSFLSPAAHQTRPVSGLRRHVCGDRAALACDAGRHA